jgi:hypothetical protein
VEGLRLGEWRKNYLRAARANDIAGMKGLVNELYSHVRGYDAARNGEPRGKAASWQALCAQAQHEQDPAKLLKLVTEINRLLEEEQGKKRKR